MPEGTDDPMHVKDAGVEFLAELFGRVSGAEVGGALELARSYRPDLVVHSAAQGRARWSPPRSTSRVWNCRWVRRTATRGWRRCSGRR